MNRMLFTAAAAVALTTSALAKPPSIDELAPDSTALVVSLRNAEVTMDGLRRTRLWDLWQSDEMKDWRADAVRDMSEGMDQMLRELGLEEDSIEPPTGEIGVAVFAVMDEDMGYPSPGFLLVADYGEGADKASELFDAVIKKAEEEDDLTYEEREIMGRNVLCFDLPQEPEVDPDAEFGEDEFMQEDMFGGNPMLGSMEHLYFVREDTGFMLCSDLDALTAALEACDGEREDVVSQRADFQGIMHQLGEHDGYAALLLGNVGELVSAFDTSGMMMFLAPMLKQYVGDVHGFGAGVRVDGPTAMIEQSMSVYMPNGKIGLTALMTTETPRGQLPRFVSPDTISFNSLNFDMPGLGKLIKQVVASMQMMMPPPAEGEAGPEEMIDRICSCFGKQIYIMGSLKRPIQVDSMKQLFVLECVKPEEMENLLEENAPQMGVEARDFLGHRVYTMDADMMSMMMPMPGGPGMGGMPAESMSLGLGGGFVYVGPTSSVEQAMRTIGQDDNASLAEDREFRRAVQALHEEQVVGWGFTNLVDSMEASVRVNELMMAQMMEQFAEEDPEMAAELEGMDMFAGPAVLDNLDFDLLRRYLGPSVWEMRSTDDGFIMSSYTIAADADD